MSLYYYLAIKHKKSTPINPSITEYLDYLGRTPILIVIYIISVTVSLPLLVIALINLYKKPPLRLKVVIFSSSTGILIFLLVSYVLFIALAFATTKVFVPPGKLSALITFTSLGLRVLVIFYPLILPIITWIVASRLYKKLDIGTRAQYRSKLIFSIGISFIWGCFIVYIISISAFPWLKALLEVFYFIDSII